MTEGKRMSEEQRQEYLRVMRGLGMPEEILEAMKAWDLQHSGHTKGEYRAYELGRKEALAECVTALQELVLELAECVTALQELVLEYDAKQYASVSGKLRELIARILAP
jgi:hypothetical protein